jgi:hypothetical protein
LRTVRHATQHRAELARDRGGRGGQLCNRRHFTWLGFVVPVLLNGVAFERKSWKVFGIAAGYQFVSMQVIAMVLACWR